MDAFKSHSHSDAQKWKAILKNIQSLSNQWECVFSTISSVLLFTKMMLFTENSLTLIASHLALTWSFSKFFLLLMFVCFSYSWVFYWFQGNWLNLLLKFTISHLERELSLELKLVIFPVIYHLLFLSHFWNRGFTVQGSD